MRFICYADGWAMIPFDVSIVPGCEIRTYYKCPHCGKIILTEESYPCDQGLKVHVDSDLEVKRL